MSNIYDCDLSRCPVEESIMYYRPSLAANSFFLAMFAVAGIAHTAQGLITRKPYFMVAMQLGCITECIGYAGRIISWNNPFSLNGFLINICCITLAPAFFSGALYFTLGDVVRNVSVTASRLRPRTYALIFIPCDCIALTLQGTGGGLASAASQDNQDVTVPTDVMVAGLGFQVATMTAFVVLCLDYAWRVRKETRSASEPIRTQCSKKTLWWFATFLGLAILGIYIRTVYRVIELAGGWTSTLYRTQRDFIVLEGVMVLMAVLSLHIGHPGNLSRGKVVASNLVDTPEAAEEGRVGTEKKSAFTRKLGFGGPATKQKSALARKLGFGGPKRASDTTLVSEPSREKAAHESQPE